MAVIGFFTNIGLDKSREAQSNEGWRIFPQSFAVANTAGAFDPTRTTAQPVFFTGNISSAVAIGQNTIQVTCVIPPNATVQSEFVREIYLYAQDVDNNPFILAIGQPSSNTEYNPDSGSIELRLQLKLSNATDINNLIQFDYTQAQEISEHNQDLNAHPLILAAINKAGLYTQQAQHVFVGQYFDEFAQFESSVGERDLVYKNANGFYERAVADGSENGNAIGFASVAQGCVVSSGFIRYPNTYPVKTRLYLSETNPGQLTSIPTKYSVGVVVDQNTISVRISNSKDIDAGYDAVVSLSEGIKHYSTFEQAIAVTPDGGKIAVRDLISLRGSDPVDTQGKQISFVFEGIDTGVTRFQGQNEIQAIEASAIPTSGEYRLEYLGEKTSRLAFDATPAQIKAALEALSGLTSVDVSGGFSTALIIEFTNSDGITQKDQIEIAAFPGEDEVQRISFSSDDFQAGSFQLDLDGQTTASIAFNEITALEIATELLNLSNLQDILVTEDGTAPAGTLAFLVNFQGVDGKQPKVGIVSANNTLADTNSDPIVITGSVVTPGVLPDVTLSDGTNDVSLASSTVQEGEGIGPDVAFRASTDGMKWIGLGKIDGFLTGIELNSQENSRIEMCFASLPTPVDYTGLELTDFNADGSLGFRPSLNVVEELGFKNLVQAQANPTPDKSLTITPAFVSLSDGSSHGIAVGRTPSSFAGGSVNFETGAVVGGENFSPYTPSTPGAFYKYGIVLTPGNTIKIIRPSGEGATANDAPDPIAINGLLRNVITIQDDGSGGFANLTAANITRHFDTGVYARVRVREKQIVTQSNVTQVQLSDFVFSPSHQVLDIKVEVDSNELNQSLTGGLDQEFRKVGNDTIEFTGDGALRPLPKFAQVTVIYTGDEIEDKASDGNVTRFIVDKFTADGVETDFTATSFQFNPSNDVDDVEVFVGRDQYFIGQDFTKSNNATVSFLRAPPRLAQVRLRSREFSAVGREAVGLEVQNVGSSISKGTGVTDYSDDFIVTKPVEGKALISLANPSAVSSVQSVGSGQGDLISALSNGNLNLRTIRGVDGIQVNVVGDEIVISLAQSGYFRTYVASPGNNTQQIGTGLPFDLGSRRLIPFKNGLFMHPGLSIKPFSNAYVENVNAIDLSPQNPASAAAEFAFVNLLNGHTWTSLTTNFQGSVLTMPFQFDPSSQREIVVRNGLIMNRNSVGTTADRYSLVGNNQLSFEDPVEPQEVIYVIYLAAEPQWREDFDSVIGSTLTFPNSRTIEVGSKRLLLFRKSQLMFDTASGSFGTPIMRYLEQSTTTLTLDVGSQSSTNWTGIYL